MVPHIGTQDRTPTSPGTQGGKAGASQQPTPVHTPTPLKVWSRNHGPQERWVTPARRSGDTDSWETGRHSLKGTVSRTAHVFKAPGASGAGRSPGSGPGLSWWLVLGREGRKGGVVAQEPWPEEQQGLQAASLPEHPLGAWRGPWGGVLRHHSDCRQAAPGVPRRPAPGPGCLSGHLSGHRLL